MGDRAILEELARRQRAKESVSGMVVSIEREYFRQQRAFVKDPSRNKAALCTRRAGKTNIWPRYATTTALENPRSLTRIWAINRLRAKQLLWSEFKYLFDRHQIQDVKLHETELTITFPNGAEIRLLGADKDKEAQKKRGDKTIMEVIIEAQLFGPYLRTLVEEVAEPCLFDLKGTFCMEGTPGPLCVGYWWCVSGGGAPTGQWVSPGQTIGNEEGVGGGWNCHHWSVLDNPFLPHAKEELGVLVKRRRWGKDHPAYVREWLGQWVNDESALFYRFDEERNTFTLAEIQPWGPGWQHVLGWDLGFRDDMSLVVWGWHPGRPDVYEAFSWKKSGALAAEVMGQIAALDARGFNFVKKVADTGGGGRMYVEEVMSRYSQVFDAAKKTEKYEHVRLMNDDLLTGRIKLQRGSAYAQEIAALPKDPDWPDPEAPETPPFEDARFPNHLCDAGLYAWRSTFHYLHEAEVPPPRPGSKEFFDASEAANIAALEKGNDREWWEPESDFTGSDFL